MVSKWVKRLLKKKREKKAIKLCGLDYSIHRIVDNPFLIEAETSPTEDMMLVPINSQQFTVPYPLPPILSDDNIITGSQAHEDRFMSEYMLEPNLGRIEMSEGVYNQFMQNRTYLDLTEEQKMIETILIGNRTGSLEHGKNVSAFILSNNLTKMKEKLELFLGKYKDRFSYSDEEVMAILYELYPNWHINRLKKDKDQSFDDEIIIETNYQKSEEEYFKLSEDCEHGVIHDGWGGCDLLEGLECSLENCPKNRLELLL